MQASEYFASNNPGTVTRDFLQAALAGVPGTGGTLRRATVAAPVVSSLDWVDAVGEETLLWQNRQAELHVGIGAAAALTASGPERFEAARAAVTALFADVRAEVVTGISAPALARVFGGFSFEDSAVTDVWSDFGGARLVCPELHYVTDGITATLTVSRVPAPRGAAAGRPATSAGSVAELVERALGLLQVLDAASSGPTSVGKAPALLEERGTSAAAWDVLVSKALGAIHAGAASKLVTARATELHVAEPLSLGQTFAVLQGSYPDCTKFALRLGQATFLGATPERLIEKRGDKIETEALAGSAGGCRPETVALLLQSAKERAEHDPVLREILSALRPFCEDLNHTAEPTVRQLRSLLHLQTRVEGRLSRPTHILELVRALHPTPAVGGVPSAFARQWLADHEGFTRGWYAGPVGWTDELGDGQFDVALRTGLLAGTRATLFAGAGIVRDSLAAQEYAETGWKLSALRDALRVRP